MTQEEIDNLIIKHILKETSSEEDKILQNWLSMNADNKKYFDDFMLIWNESEDSASHETFNAIDENKAWENVKPTVASRKITPWWAYASAAAIVLGTVITFLLLRKNTSEPVQIAWNHVTNHEDHPINYSLPDSSIVTIAVDSKIQFPENFNQIAREIRLEGKAFFDVTKDSQRPFVVHTQNINVKVLGTQFSVDIEKNKTQVAVQEGKVWMYKNKSMEDSVKGILLTKNNIGEYSNSSKSISEHKMLTNNIFAWKSGNIISFANTPMPEVIADIEDIFDVKIVNESAKLNSKTFNGKFHDPTIQKVFNSLESTYNVKVTLKDSVYYIH
ncbi:FecR family protein [Aureibacter tunicatorum]|uniref:Ferric-dicitrate binding protein FerR (Iron transport regulator) n=1 Tax=Aureibacter tunicatorum TaxID=866807 RepID=A0AAE3XSX4_9BACT|nr:FecR family protein [Aureibacter tunicatorum]MDR6241291.1 ferric-dicitrate binding protein FerR (iron transport regulator) [Aureibacter tunicatorum]BDD03551.1 hypothetical protein AUTU_10340 [Aureibacter tunicatorum]